MTTLLTGATGYLGNALLEKLLLSGEYVRVFCRFPDYLGKLATDPNVEIFQGDLEDPEDIAEAVCHVKRIYHTAAVVKEWVTDWNVFERINLLAWENIIRAAMAEKVERIVYTSSFMALGPSEKARDGDENLTHNPKHFHNQYELTKYLGHKKALEYVEKGAPIVVVCPGLIFGPGLLTEGNFAAGLVKQIADGTFSRLPGKGKTRWCFSYIDDVVKGHMAAMTKGEVGQSYILGGQNHSLAHFVYKVCEFSGLKEPRGSIPLWVVWSIAALMEKFARMAKTTPMITKGRAGVMKHHWAYQSGKALLDLGYTITPFDDALRNTIGWMKKDKLI